GGSHAAPTEREGMSGGRLRYTWRSTTNRNRCAGSLFTCAHTPATLTPAPQAVVARPSLRHACSTLFLLSNSLT
ncbi:MAG: hypothetical protein NTX51_16265, partial [Verrucomicrobia bacterium]|nr:hypothetical protein [Verrucomicrobiota bacterium]